MIDVKEITDQSTWDHFLTSLQPNTFLQSWAWGQVQKTSGETVRYLGIFASGQQIGCALTITVQARRGVFLLIPHGPIFSQNLSPRKYLPPLVNHLKKIAQPDKAVAIRIAPLLLDTPQTRQLFQELGFHPAPLHMHAELTWLKDISQPADVLLSNMRKTTRHAINKALKDPDLNVAALTDPDQIITRFWPLYQKTGHRHDFVLWSRSLILDQLKQLDSYAIFARYKNQDVAAAIVLKFGATAFYYHGASLKMPSRLPASHLVQWQAMLTAKERNCVQYNFWGIAPDDQTNHPFAGITVFKKGFGGQALNYLHAQDLPITWRYARLWLVDTYRRLKRGF